jgi:hypothetical protein
MRLCNRQKIVTLAHSNLVLVPLLIDERYIEPGLKLAGVIIFLVGERTLVRAWGDQCGHEGLLLLQKTIFGILRNLYVALISRYFVAHSYQQ